MCPNLQFILDKLKLLESKNLILQHYIIVKYFIRGFTPNLRIKELNF